MQFDEFRDHMASTYGHKDAELGINGTIAWLTEEFGELAQAIRKGTEQEQLHELGDVLAWLASLAAQLDLSMEEAIERYAGGCPKCHQSRCSC